MRFGALNWNMMSGSFLRCTQKVAGQSVRHLKNIYFKACDLSQQCTGDLSHRWKQIVAVPPETGMGFSFKQIAFLKLWKISMFPEMILDQSCEVFACARKKNYKECNKIKSCRKKLLLRGALATQPPFPSTSDDPLLQY